MTGLPPVGIESDFLVVDRPLHFLPVTLGSKASKRRFPACYPHDLALWLGLRQSALGAKRAAQRFPGGSGPRASCQISLASPDLTCCSWFCFGNLVYSVGRSYSNAYCMRSRLASSGSASPAM
jgi:hypothetical protein